MWRTTGLLLLLVMAQLCAADTRSNGDSTSVLVTNEEGLPVVDKRGDSVTVVESAAEDQIAGSDTTVAPKSVSVASDTTKTNNIKKIKLIKREYNYGQQLALAIGMMSFIAIMMASTQNWNPK